MFTFSAITCVLRPIILLYQVGNAIKTNRALRQWVDLGDLSPFTCMTLPENCGPDGGALSAWIKLIDCPPGTGFLGSRTDYLTGLKTVCTQTTIK